MHVDFKVTTWERVEIPAEHEAEIMEAISNGKITSANDIFEQFPSDELTCDKLDDVDEQMTPEENGGCNTIEAFDGRELLWGNGDDSENS